MWYFFTKLHQFKLSTIFHRQYYFRCMFLTVFKIRMRVRVCRTTASVDHFQSRRDNYCLEIPGKVWMPIKSRGGDSQWRFRLCRHCTAGSARLTLRRKRMIAARCCSVSVSVRTVRSLLYSLFLSLSLSLAYARAQFPLRSTRRKVGTLHAVLK